MRWENNGQIPGAGPDNGGRGIERRRAAILEIRHDPIGQFRHLHHHPAAGFFESGHQLARVIGAILLWHGLHGVAHCPGQGGSELRLPHDQPGIRVHRHPFQGPFRRGRDPHPHGRHPGHLPRGVHYCPQLAVSGWQLAISFQPSAVSFQL